MIRATQIEGQNIWQGPLAGFVELDFVGRRRRRFVMTCTNGFEFLLDLDVTPHMHHGQRMVLEDARRIEIIAAQEPLIEISADSPAQLTELAYHLGNRHLEAQLLDDRILIRPDHVIEDMVRGLGGTVLPVSHPFEPISGAYGGGHSHD